MTRSAGYLRTRSLVRTVFWILACSIVLAVASILLDVVLRAYLEGIVLVHNLVG